MPRTDALAALVGKRAELTNLARNGRPSDPLASDTATDFDVEATYSHQRLLSALATNETG